MKLKVELMPLRRDTKMPESGKTFVCIGGFDDMNDVGVVLDRLRRRDIDHKIARVEREQFCFDIHEGNEIIRALYGFRSDTGRAIQHVLNELVNGFDMDVSEKNDVEWPVL